MALESWELIIFNLAIGSLLSGALLFFFSIFTSGFQFGHFGHGSHVGHIGHFSHFHTHLSSKINQNASTPILLIFSAFLLMFGAIGTVIYQSEWFNPWIRLLLAIFLPLIFVKLVSLFWNKLVTNESGYEIPVVSIDNQVTTLTSVDETGGLVLADTGDLNRPDTLRSGEKMKMPAKTLPNIVIERGQIAYVIDIDKKNTLIIDLWPKQAGKKMSSKKYS